MKGNVTFVGVLDSDRATPSRLERKIKIFLISGLARWAYFAYASSRPPLSPLSLTGPPLFVLMCMRSRPSFGSWLFALCSFVFAVLFRVHLFVQNG